MATPEKVYPGGNYIVENIHDGSRSIVWTPGGVGWWRTPHDRSEISTSVLLKDHKFVSEHLDLYHIPEMLKEEPTAPATK